ncbi:hypothetical protein [Streptomyces sp. NPDC001348]
MPGIGKSEFREVERRIEAVERTANAALVGDGPDRGAVDDSAAWDVVRDLVAEYVTCVWSCAAARRGTMDQIFARLVRATQRVRDFDAGELLRSQDAGMRLAAYARLYGMPEPEALGALVEAAKAATEDVPLSVVRRVEEFRSRASRANDRREIVDRMLAGIGGH